VIITLYIPSNLEEQKGCIICVDVTDLQSRLTFKLKLKFKVLRALNVKITAF